MTSNERSIAIRKRFAAGDPLNISAVKAEAPLLLEGLYDPKAFIGWRRAIEAAGISYETIKFYYSGEVKCPLCGYSDVRLSIHFADEHGVTVKELRQDLPEAEELCDEIRSTQFGWRHGSPSLVMVPHWERVWSKYYALDRLRWLADHGHPVNYKHVATHEPGLAAYLRRVLRSWDAVLEAIGFRAADIRLTAVQRDLGAEEVVEELRSLLASDPSLLHMKYVADFLTVFTAALRQFGTYEAALAAAGIDAAPLIPALGSPELVKQRALMLAELQTRLKSRKKYSEADVASFYERYEAVMKGFYATWVGVMTSIGRLGREVFYSPSHGVFRSAAGVIKALRSRHSAGLPMAINCVIVDNPSLLHAADKRFFKNWDAALVAANTLREPRNLEFRAFATPEILLEFLKEQAAAGMEMKSQDPILLLASRWAFRYFGSWSKAVAAAGLQLPLRKKHVVTKPKPKRFLSDEDLLNGLQQRAAEGKSMRLTDVNQTSAKGGDVALYREGMARFSTYKKALEAAGLTDESTRIGRTRFFCADDVISALVDRMRKGVPTTAGVLSRGVYMDGGLARAIGRHFPTADAAFMAAAEKAGVKWRRVRAKGKGCG